MMASWLFLLVSLVGAALVYNAYRPLAAGARVSALSFFIGWLTGELGIHHIAWQGIATLIFAYFGALEAAPGQLGLAITLVSWVALGLHYARGFAVEGTVENALAEGFGEDYQARILPELRGSLPKKVDWGPILAPFPIRHPNVERIKNIVYGRAAAINLKLDVYRHKTPKLRCPTLIYVHGGGWVMGSKNQQGLPLVYHLASKGWLCVNVNYRLSPHATFPDHLVDLKRAIHWVRTKGVEYGADPNFIVASGGSAGGHLAALMALTANDPEYQPGFEDADTRLQGCVPIYGVYDMVGLGEVWHHDEFKPWLERHVMKASYDEEPKKFEKASPVHRVNSDAPPFFVIHGALDTLVPVDEARVFVRALQEKSKATVAYAEIPDAQHAFELFPSLRSQLTRQGIERFLALVLSAHRRQTGG